MFSGLPIMRIVEKVPGEPSEWGTHREGITQPCSLA